ncbi:MAG TPA: maltose alpha-D-glucosyltransferase [Ktedonobacterales bacterium]
MSSDGLWYKDSIFYELHVKAFYDSNADGVGDFRGLMEKLDYLQDLGVDCLWILPFYPSPMRDDGYDIADYYDVHPAYGTLADFKAFLRAAHHRRLRVITDLVMNHTSDQHAWFQEARRSPRSRYRNYYVWSQTNQRYQDARIIFTDTERSNWTWDQDAGAYYWHRFFSHQPDLNYDNPQVRRSMMKMIRYWMDMGIDGFRMDAVPYLYEREGTNCENLPETHEYLKQVRCEMDRRYPDKILLCEANQWPQDVRSYFGDGDECQMAFNFPVMPRLFMSLRREDRLPIVDIIERTPGIPANCQWGMFLRNHDELTLEMVTDEERDYMWHEFAGDPRMKLNLGIRRRLAPLMGNGRRQMELLTSLLFTLPGSPIIYYGDELGMGDNIYLGDRNGVRTPMQWSSDRNAGFSKADTAMLYSPPIVDPVYGYQSVNVEAQLRTPSSLLNWTKRMIRIRRRYPVFGRGSIEFLNPENRKVLAYLRSDGEQTVLVVANLSRFSQPVELDMRRFKGMTPVELIGETTFPTVREDLPYFLSLGPHGFYWFRLDKPAEQVIDAEAETAATASSVPALVSSIPG